MPIPALNEHGLLPAGIHDCTLDELKSRFGSFQISDRRNQLFRRFERFVADAQAAQFPRSLLIDGSFVTGEPTPNDIDLVLVLSRSHDVAADLPPGHYNLVSRRSVRRRYGFDIVVVRENGVEYEEAVAFFQQVRGQPLCGRAF
jgi:hypothetical protein